MFRRGFSLSELIIVCSIISIMTVVALVSINGTNRFSKEVESAAREVAVAIREAQNNALGGKQPDYNSKIIACGHGFYFANNGDSNYKIFYNPKTETDCSTAKKNYDAAASRNYVSYSLPNGIKFSAGKGAIYFDSPHGNVYRDGSLLTSVLTITITKNFQSYNICVYPSGNVLESKNPC